MDSGRLEVGDGKLVVGNKEVICEYGIRKERKSYDNKTG